jgi:glutathione peroxidase
MTTLHDFEAKTIDGTTKPLRDFEGKALLVVNVASQCGLTPQYAQLEALYEKYRARGLEILGFPSNQFGAQEPGTDAEIKTFCESKFGVEFPMFSKVDVNGADAHALYGWLREQTGGKDIGWNFEKFLIGKNGAVVARFSPKTSPDDPKLVEAIEKALA